MCLNGKPGIIAFSLIATTQPEIHTSAFCDGLQKGYVRDNVLHCVLDRLGFAVIH